MKSPDAPKVAAATRSKRIKPRARSGQRGSVMVESSLILMIFLMVFIAICDVGQVLFIHQFLTERVRNAARYGAITLYDQTAIQNMVLYNSPAAPTDGSGPAFNLTPSMIMVQRLAAGTTDDRITVTVVNYPFTFVTPFIAGAVRGLPITASLPYEER